jgi:hypothetical protein
MESKYGQKDRDVFQKPSGDFQEMPDIEDEDPKELVNETIELFKGEQQFIDAHVQKAEAKRKQKEAERKTIQLGLMREKEKRLDAHHATIFLESSFEDDGLDIETGYVYDRLLAPGDLLLQFLAPKEKDNAPRPDVPSHVLARQQQRKNLKRLRMWMPDTVVYCGVDGPFWLFSHRNGLLYRTQKFETSMMISKLGSRKFPEDPICLHKESILVPASVPPTDPPKFAFHGNKTAVVNTLELERLVETFSNAKEDSVSVIQRFIKCKGPQACTFRTMVRDGKQPTGWCITNKARFDARWSAKEEEEGIAVNGLTARLCTHARSRKQSSIFPLTSQSVGATAALTRNVMEHLERQIHRKFETFVCDFIRDDSDEYWMTQIKGYRLKAQWIHRPVKLSAKQQKALLHSKNMYTHENDIDTATPSTANLPPVGGRRVKPQTVKTSKCRFCELQFHASMLPYKMTLKMIRDTRRRLQLRIPRSRFVALFGSKKRKKVANSSSDRTQLYRAYDVCRGCYKLYQSDVKLQVLENKFSAALSIPSLADGFVGDLAEQMKAAQSAMRIGERKNTFSAQKKARRPRTASSTGSRPKSPVRRPKEGCEEDVRQRRMFIKNAKKDSLMEALTDSQSERPIPPEVTMYRMLVVLHEVHDFPKAFYDQLVSDGRVSKEANHLEEDFFLVYEVLGTKCAIPLRIRETYQEGKPVYVHRMRIHYFFGAVPSPVNTNLDTSRHGIDIFLTRTSDMLVHLCKGFLPDGTVNTFPLITKDYGPSKMGLRQFKSKFVNKHEVYAPFGLGAGGICSLRATVGVEHVRNHLDSRLLDDDPHAHFEQGVFVPSISFSTPDPLPNEWLETLGSTHHTHYHKGKDGHFSEVVDDSDTEAVVDTPEVVLYWAIQFHVHALSYLCDLLPNGKFDTEARYFLKYEMCGRKVQTADVSPTPDPYETGKPLLVFETSDKHWASGPVSRMKDFFGKRPEMAVEVYRRHVSPRQFLEKKLARVFYESDYNGDGCVTLKELGNGMVYNPTVVQTMLSAQQRKQRDEFEANEAKVNRERAQGISPRKSARTLQLKKAPSLAGAAEVFGWDHGQFGPLSSLIDGLQVYGELKRLEAWVRRKGKVLNGLNHPMDMREWVATVLRTSRLRHIFEATIAYRGCLPALSGTSKVRAAAIAAEVASKPAGPESRSAGDVGRKGLSFSVRDLPVDERYDDFMNELRHHAGKPKAIGAVTRENLIWALTEGAEDCDKLCPSADAVSKLQREKVLEQVNLLPDYKPVTWFAFLRAGMSADFGTTGPEPSSAGVLVGRANVLIGILGPQRELDGTFDVDTTVSEEPVEKHRYPPYLSASAFILEIKKPDHDDSSYFNF